jgi:hypothetical protein
MPLNAPFLRPFLPLLGYLLAAHAAHAAEVMYPPGSRLGLVPPPGMALSSNFFGFEEFLLPIRSGYVHDLKGGQSRRRTTMRP